MSQESGVRTDSDGAEVVSLIGEVQVGLRQVQDTGNSTPSSQSKFTAKPGSGLHSKTSSDQVPKSSLRGLMDLHLFESFLWKGSHS